MKTANDPFGGLRGRALGRPLRAGGAPPGPLGPVPHRYRRAGAVAPDGARLHFLLNHAPEPAHLTAHTTATDLLTGKRVEEGEPLTLDPLGTLILRSQ